MLLSRKRPHSPDISDEHSCERNKCYPTFVLESESPLPTDEDSESYYSVQLEGTVSPKDTSDTSWSSDSLTMDVEMDEYDVASITHSDEKLMSNCDSSGTDEMICTAAVTTVLVASNLCEDKALWADSSDVGSDSTTDSEVPKADYWDCVRCKSKCSPLNPYCLKCFQGNGCTSIKSCPSMTLKNIEDKNVYRMKNKRTTSGFDSEKYAENEFVGLKWNSYHSKVKHLQLYCSCFKCLKMSYFPASQHVYPRGKKREVLQSFTASAQSFSSDLMQTASSNSTKEQPGEGEKDGGVNEMGQSTKQCTLCRIRPKNSGFVHNGEIHVLYCYQCSLRTLKKNRKCPLCKKRPKKIVKLCYA